MAPPPFMCLFRLLWQRSRSVLEQSRLTVCTDNTKVFYCVLYTTKILKEGAWVWVGATQGIQRFTKQTGPWGAAKGILPSRKLTLQLHESTGAGGLGNKLDHSTKGQDWAEAPRTSWQWHRGPVLMCRSFMESVNHVQYPSIMHHHPHLDSLQSKEWHPLQLRRICQIFIFGDPASLGLQILGPVLLSWRFCLSLSCEPGKCCEQNSQVILIMKKAFVPQDTERLKSVHAIPKAPTAELQLTDLLRSRNPFNQQVLHLWSRLHVMSDIPQQVALQALT